jgi:hypothetical protein
MKRQSKFFTNPNSKILFMLICITIGFAGFTKCDAQSIVGKWKGVSVKYFNTPALAKQTGKEMQESPSKEVGNYGYEFKSDHTFTNIHFTVTNSSEVIMKGTWSLSGDQLTTTLDAHQPDPKYNPKKGDAPVNQIIQISGNSLIITWVKPNPRVNKIEYAYKKM